MNIQFAVKKVEGSGEKDQRTEPESLSPSKHKVYILEVNPRASRTVPFVSKATGRSLAKVAAKVMAGRTLKELGFTEELTPDYWAVKESVFPFNRFHGQDILLSPEMKSTGEVMGLDADLGIDSIKRVEILSAMLREARDRADFSGARTEAMSIAADVCIYTNSHVTIEEI